MHTDGAQVTVAYPFSGSPTPHRVRLDGGPELTAMCAIDALGIPQMAGTDGVITSSDTATGRPIRVELADGRWRWAPEHAVVVWASGSGFSCDCECSHMGFHATDEAARAYLRDHPGLSADILDQATAIEAAAVLFGSLLR